jgi:hypothetical protein
MFWQLLMKTEAERAYQREWGRTHRSSRAASARKYRAAHPADARAASQRSKKKRTIQRREWLRQQKDVPCADCGVKYPSYVLHFHHRVPAQKKFTIGRGAITQIAMERLVREVAKCDVLCANCHAERTWGRKD